MAREIGGASLPAPCVHGASTVSKLEAVCSEAASPRCVLRPLRACTRDCLHGVILRRVSAAGRLEPVVSREISRSGNVRFAAAACEARCARSPLQ